jgi:hypothetical protein
MHAAELTGLIFRILGSLAMRLIASMLYQITDRYLSWIKVISGESHCDYTKRHEETPRPLDV